MLLPVLLLVMMAGSLTSCVDEEEFANTPRGNFEALWKIIDEHYCFFNEKNSQYGLDWNEVRAHYAPQFDDRMTEANCLRCWAICWANCATDT